MKTIQVGKGRVKVLQFETLQEIQKIYSNTFIVDHFNLAFFNIASKRADHLEKCKKEKK